MGETGRAQTGTLTLGKKTGVLLLLPLIGTLASLVMFGVYLDKTRHDTHFVNVAGRQRMLAVEMGVWARKVAIGVEESRESLRERVGEFASAMAILETGGEVLGESLGPAPSDLRTELQALVVAWAAVKPDLERVATLPRSEPGFATALHRVEVGTSSLRDSSHALVSMFEVRANRLRAQAFAALTVTAAGTVAIFLVGIYLTRRFIVNPVMQIEQAAKRISDGDFTSRVEVRTGDELATLAGSFNEMTEKVRRLLDVLQKRRRHAERIVAGIPVGLLVADENLRILAVNRAFVECCRTESETQVVGQLVSDVVGAPELEAHLRHVLATDETRAGLLFDRCCKGSPVPHPVRASISALRRGEDEAGAGAGGQERLLVVLEDLTEEERRQAHLSFLETRFQDVFESASDGILLMEQDGTISGFNAAAERIFGWRRDEVLGKPMTLLMPQQFHVAHRQALSRRVAGLGQAGVMASGLIRLALHKDGTVFPIELSVGSSRVGGRFAFTGVFRDIRERQRAEDALRRSEESFRLLIEVAPDAVVVHRDGRVVYANPAAASLLGYDAPRELTGAETVEFLHPEERQSWLAHIEKVVAAKTPAPPHEHRMLRRDGAILTWEVTTSGIAFDGTPATLIVGRDVTERRQMVARMMQMDRMASVGTLAAGVGHEINNPLTYVMANVDFVVKGMPEVSDTLQQLLAAPVASEAREAILVAATRIAEMQQALADVREGTERVRRIVRDLKAFSRAEEERLYPVNLQQVAESALNMAWNEIRHRARLVKEYTPTPPVIGNDARLGQVILNLLVNAAQAIPEGHVDTNEIRIRTWTNGERVFLEVRDTGTGIAPDVLPRIFDPFFTTKPIGQGTGLGLGIAHAIISSLGGELTVESAPGAGAAFRIGLQPAPAIAVELPPRPRAVEQKKHGRILIIDDEPLVGMALNRVLERDHHVQTVTSGREALALLGRDSYDLILCDLMMPEMTGMEFYERLSAASPAIAGRIVFLTGGAFTPHAKEFLERVPNRRIEKPVDPKVLGALLLELLA